MPYPIYVPGREVVCTSLHFAAEYHSRGWCAPEEELTWIDGVQGELQFVVHRPSFKYMFKAEITPLEGDTIQTLEVFFNYFRVAFFEVTHSQNIEIELPSELFTLRAAQFVFHCPRAMVGTSVGLADSRRLGIAFRKWIVE